MKAVLAQPKWPLIWQSDTVRAPRNVKKVAPLGCAVEAASGHRGKKVIIAGDCPHKYRAAPLLLNRPRFSTLDQQGPHPTTSQKIEGAIVRASLSGWSNSTMTRGDASVPFPFSTHAPPMSMARVMACLICSGSLLVT